MKKPTLTLKDLEKLKESLEDIEPSKEIIISSKVYRNLEKWWNSFTWWEKLIIRFVPEKWWPKLNH